MENLVSQRKCTRQKSLKRMAKMHELGFELLPQPPYSPDVAQTKKSLPKLKPILKTNINCSTRAPSKS